MSTSTGRTKSNVPDKSIVEVLVDAARAPGKYVQALDSEYDRLTAMEEQMVFFPKEYLWLKRTTSKANGGAGKTNF
jgi:hypothetical protein